MPIAPSGVGTPQASAVEPSATALIDVNDVNRLDDLIAAARTKPANRAPEPPVAEDDLSRLSPREHQVVLLIACGLTNKEIAARLSLSEKTVKSRISKIFAKHRVATRRQLILHAVQNGII